MKNINWIKRYSVVKTLADRYEIKPGELYSGVISIISDNQNLDSLEYDKKEYLKGNCNIPFLSFSIIIDKTGMYNLSSVSPISLKDYTEQNLRVEEWYKSSNIDDCILAAENVLNTFIKNFGKNNNG